MGRLQKPCQATRRLPWHNDCTKTASASFASSREQNHAARQPNTAETRVGRLLAERFQAVRDATLELAAPLAVEDQVVQASAETSPTKWHLGHTTWFFERFVLCARQPSTPRRRSLRAGIQLVLLHGRRHAPRAERGNLSRPTLAEIHDYRSRIDEATLDLLAARPDDAELAAIIELGLNHEEQHQELLLTDAKQVLFANVIDVAYRATVAPPRTEARYRSSSISSRPGSRRSVPTRTASRSTTSGRGIESGSKPICSQTGSAPTASTASSFAAGGYSVPHSGSRTVDRGPQPRLESTALLVSRPRARVHARRLAAARRARAGVSRQPLRSGSLRRLGGRPTADRSRVGEPRERMTPARGNLRETGWLHPAAAHRAPAARAESPPDLGRRLGMVCVGLSTLPRFRPLPGSLGEYNGKFMSNQWVVRGGSCVTPAGHVRATYRNFFYPHDRWQFLGIRLAKDA